MAETLDIKRMRACSPLLPDPGGEVVCQCLDEIERLRAIIDVSPCRPIDEKLRRLRSCILDGSHEDAQEHIFDLLRGLRCKDTPDHELTPSGLEAKSLWAMS